MRILSAFFADIGGATAIEYGLIAALISVALVAGMQTLGGDIGNVFLSLSNHMTSPN